MAQVFLSYSHQDRAVADKLARELRAAGASVFSGHDKIEAGSSVSAVMSRELAEAKVFVSIDEGSTAHSRHLLSEVDTAVSRSMAGGLAVLPVRLAGRGATDKLNAFRHIEVGLDGNLDRVVAIVLDSLITHPRAGIDADESKLAFLGSLLRADLAKAPLAASLVLDELSRSIGADLDQLNEQLDHLRDALAWGTRHLGHGHPSVATLTHRLSDALFRLQRFAEAASLNEEILASAASPADTVIPLLNMADALSAQEEWAQAEKRYLDVLAVARRNGYSSAAATALVRLGRIKQRERMLSDAVHLFEEALDVSTALGDPSARVDALIGLSEVCLQNGDVDAGIEYAASAMELAQAAVGPEDALTRRAAAAVRAVRGS